MPTPSLDPRRVFFFTTHSVANHSRVQILLNYIRRRLLREGPVLSYCRAGLFLVPWAETFRLEFGSRTKWRNQLQSTVSRKNSPTAINAAVAVQPGENVEPIRSEIHLPGVASARKDARLFCDIILPLYSIKKNSASAEFNSRIWADSFVRWSLNRFAPRNYEVLCPRIMNDATPLKFGEVGVRSIGCHDPRRRRLLASNAQISATGGFSVDAAGGCEATDP